MRIVIPGKPIPKQRARHANRGKYVVTYDPQEKDKKRVQEIITSQLSERANSLEKLTAIELGKICSAKAFSVKFIFFLPVNQSDSVSAKNKKLWGITKANVKPDYDNMEKFYLDCANGILWDDDAKVIKGTAEKLYSEEPRVEIEVKAVKEINLNEKIAKVITAFSPSEFMEMQEYAEKIALLDLPAMAFIEDDDFQVCMVSTSILLSEFAIKYASKLTKIAKLGDIKSEITKYEEFCSVVESKDCCSTET